MLIQFQVEALKWISKHIRSFGGDKHSVTLFGQGGGARSVHAHVLSPLSRGLFHRVILQSGTMLQLVDNIRRKTTERSSDKLVDMLSCRRRFLRDKIRCLQEMDFLDVLRKTVNSTGHYSSCDGVLDRIDSSDPADHLDFFPTVDSSARVPFLPEDPIAIMKKRDFNKVPMIIGLNRDEGGRFIRPLWRDRPRTVERWRDIAGVIFLHKVRI